MWLTAAYSDVRGAFYINASSAHYAYSIDGGVTWSTQNNSYGNIDKFNEYYDIENSKNNVFGITKYSTTEIMVFYTKTDNEYFLSIPKFDTAYFNNIPSDATQDGTAVFILLSSVSTASSTYLATQLSFRNKNRSITSMLDYLSSFEFPNSRKWCACASNRDTGTTIALAYDTNICAIGNYYPPNLNYVD